LFVVTCLSTLLAGSAGPFLNRYESGYGPALSLWLGFIDGLTYAVPVMTILVCHEMGHFVQAWRNGVYASLPYFIPMPISPIGTFGAVIAMEPRRGDRRAVFDIGISGPLAGLVPTIIFLLVGLHYSYVVKGKPSYGEPLLMKFIINALFGSIPEGYKIAMHPMAFAGWVGLLITSLNLIPIGQLDGGHVLYGMIRHRAHEVAKYILIAAIVAVIALGYWQWSLMLILLTMMGIRHPPTADDDAPLGAGRYILGVLTLAFVIIGFTPTPFSMP
jgi:membrane-associated protease RseP (regulator of RpoE activity)